MQSTANESSSEPSCSSYTCRLSLPNAVVTSLTPLLSANLSAAQVESDLGSFSSGTATVVCGHSFPDTSATPGLVRGNISSPNAAASISTSCDFPKVSLSLSNDHFPAATDHLSILTSPALRPTTLYPATPLRLSSASSEENSMHHSEHSIGGTVLSDDYESDHSVDEDDLTGSDQAFETVSPDNYLDLSLSSFI
ncbi:unnamed protein product [Protopolystoma xenopodis]|uniref:Uncharacterized protein n=1 Tax=Protopolystoma xenopodis TaxID=117903 RepID=A0A3S5BTH9_9PLAT|nr:unnamed protein product [Protopolystoma xenopodis]